MASFPGVGKNQTMRPWLSMISAPWSGFGALMAWGPRKMNPSASEPLSWRMVTGGGDTDCALVRDAGINPNARSADAVTKGPRAPGACRCVRSGAFFFKIVFLCKRRGPRGLEPPCPADDATDLPQI